MGYLLIGKMILLQTLIESIINDERKKREGQPDPIEILKRYAKTNGRYYVHFTNGIDGDQNHVQLTVNINSAWNTPDGIYGYPVNNFIVNKFTKNDGGSYAMDYAFLIIFEAKNPNKVLHLGAYDEANLATDIQKIKSLSGFTPPFNFNTWPEFVDHVIQNGGIHTTVQDKGGFEFEIPPFDMSNPGEAIWLLTMNLVNGNVTAWNRIFRALGYDGVEDPGDGIIHENEPEQAVFFTNGTIQTVGTFANPKHSKDDQALTKIELGHFTPNELIKYSKDRNFKEEIRIAAVEKYFSEADALDMIKEFDKFSTVPKLFIKVLKPRLVNLEVVVDNVGLEVFVDFVSFFEKLNDQLRQELITGLNPLVIQGIRIMLKRAVKERLVQPGASLEKYVAKK
jgi:hypothetical protein